MKHRLYITRYIFIAYVYELKAENHPGPFFIPPQAIIYNITCREWWGLDRSGSE
jgi:hypothetical protein